MVNGFYYSLFKKSKAVDANNYRPIDFTFTMRKLMESIIQDYWQKTSQMKASCKDSKSYKRARLKNNKNHFEDSPCTTMKW
jgi:hypothetical protein